MNIGNYDDTSTKYNFLKRYFVLLLQKKKKTNNWSILIKWFDNVFLFMYLFKLKQFLNI